MKEIAKGKKKKGEEKKHVVEYIDSGHSRGDCAVHHSETVIRTTASGGKRRHGDGGRVSGRAKLRRRPDWAGGLAASS